MSRRMDRLMDDFHDGELNGRIFGKNIFEGESSRKINAMS